MAAVQVGKEHGINLDRFRGGVRASEFRRVIVGRTVVALFRFSTVVGEHSEGKVPRIA